MSFITSNALPKNCNASVRRKKTYSSWNSKSKNVGKHARFVSTLVLFIHDNYDVR